MNVTRKLMCNLKGLKISRQRLNRIHDFEVVESLNNLCPKPGYRKALLQAIWPSLGSFFFVFIVLLQFVCPLCASLYLSLLSTVAHSRGSARVFSFPLMPRETFVTEYKKWKMIKK